MTYLPRHNRSSDRRARVALWFAGAAVIIVLALFWLAPNFFPALFGSVARPFWRAEFSVASGSFVSTAALLAENESLKRQLTDQAVQTATAEAVRSENGDLKALMDRASTTLPQRILAAVLIRPPVAPYDEFVIDVGADHHIASTSLVYAPGDVLIGRVADVLDQTSTVVLFSSPGQRYDVLVGPSHMPATAVGQGGGQYGAQLPQAAKVSRGDAVMAPTISSIPFGIVSAVIQDPAQPFETVLFAPPVNVYQLRWVTVSVSVPTVPTLAPVSTAQHVPASSPSSSKTKK